MNRLGDIAAKHTIDKRVDFAGVILNNLDWFHTRCNMLIYLVDKVFLSIQVYNSSFFHQKLVYIEFTAAVKDIINTAVKELDAVYKHRNPQWKDSLIDSP